MLHPLPLPRGGGEPADDRRDRPVRARSPSSSSAPCGSSRRTGTRSCRDSSRRARERADGGARTAASRASRRAPGKFPGPSLIPALHAIQREHGWLPREALVTLAATCAGRCTRSRGSSPSIRTSARRRRPRGVEVAVCRDLSCRLARSRAGAAGGRGRARGLAASAAATGRRSRSWTSAIRRPTAATGGGRTTRTPSVDEHYRVLPLVHRRPGAGARRLRPQGHGRRRLPDRQEVGDGARPGGRAEVRDLQRRRGRAGHVQGPPDPRRAAAPGDRGDADRDARDRRATRAGSSSATSTSPRSTCCARSSRARGGRRARRRDDRRLHLARRLHPRRGDRADRVHGGPPRRAAQQAAVPRRLRPARAADADEQRRDVRVGADHPRARGGLVEGAGRQRRLRAEVLLRLRPRRGAGRVLRAGRDDGRRGDRARRRDARRRRRWAACSRAARRRTSSGRTASTCR